MTCRSNLLVSFLMLWCVALPSAGQVSFATQRYQLANAFPGEYPLLATGDFNHDGKPDVAVLNYGAGSVSVLLNNGDGTLAAQRDFPVLTPDPYGPDNFLRLALADVNGDHKLDVIVSHHTTDGSGTGVIEVLLGNGDGTLQPAVTTNLGFFTRTFLGVGDFNGDKKLDLAILGAPESANTLVPLLGNGDGTFTTGAPLKPELGLDSQGTLVADINRDGKLDVLLSGVDNSNDMMVIPGSGDGTFQTPVTIASQAPATYALTSGDFNHDGIPDLLSTSFQIWYCEFKVCYPRGPAGSLTVMLGNGDGRFGGPGMLSSGVDFSNPTVGEFDGDGNLDFAVVSLSQSGPAFYFGNGRGGFSPPAAIGVTIDQPNEAADLNGDGLDDLVALDFPQSDTAEVLVQLNTTPNFFFKPVSSSQQVQPGGSATFTINIGQQNGFANPIALSCASQTSEGIHCSLSPSSATPGSAVTLTVTTTASSAAANTRSAGGVFYALCLPPIGLAAVGVGKPKNRTRVASFLLCCLILAGVSLQVACGGGGSPAKALTPALRREPTASPSLATRGHCSAPQWSRLRCSDRRAPAVNSSVSQLGRHFDKEVAHAHRIDLALRDRGLQIGHALLGRVNELTVDVQCWIRSEGGGAKM